MNGKEQGTQGGAAGLSGMKPLGVNQLPQPVNKQLSDSGSGPALCEWEGWLQGAAS